MKKAIIALSVFGLLVAVPALACFGGGCGYFSADQSNIGNSATVINIVSATSVTGANSIGNSSASKFACSSVGDVKDNSITTGDAYSTANSTALVNSNYSGCCGWFGTSQKNIFNSAYVGSSVSAASETGFNAIGNSSASKFAGSSVGDVKDNSITTGDAYSTANSTLLVNSNVKESCCGGSQLNFLNTANVGNGVEASAVTGANDIGNSTAEKFAHSSVGDVEDNSITTGDAYSTANSILLVNSNVTRGFSFPHP